MDYVDVDKNVVSVATLSENDIQEDERENATESNDKESGSDHPIVSLSITVKAIHDLEPRFIFIITLDHFIAHWGCTGNINGIMISMSCTED